MVTGEVLVSFIIPIYNAEKYLDRCLGSVVAMKSKNIEIIIVDDGSTDASSSIYRKYKDIDNRIKIIQKENGGVSSARNKGICVANGEWIAFIDGDDEIIPKVYDSFLLQLDSRSELWMLGLEQRYQDFCDTKREVIRGIWLDKDIEVIKKCMLHQDMKQAKKFRKQGFNFGGPYVKFYQRKIIVENNLLFPENLTICEDSLFNFLYLNYVKKISYTNECAYYYWQNENSAIHRFEKGRGKEWMRTVEYAQEIFKNYLLEYAQFGVRLYLRAMQFDWCFIGNNDSYFVRKKEAMQWRKRECVDKAFKNFKISQIRWEAIPIAFCAKMKWFLLCDLMLKLKEKLSITLK